jgi:signal transduction histidine kinase/ligand-binding sensor domain-containing protein
LLFELQYLKRDQLRKLLATFLLLGVGAFLFAQNQSQHYRIRTYSREQGLDQSQVREILQDSRGYLWMAMQGGGVSRFDGLRFKNYRKDQGLLSNDVGAMCLDKLGNLWFACDKAGLSCYNGSKFTTLDKQQGIEFENSKALFCSADNQIWLGTEGEGIFIWDGKKTRRIQQSDGLPSDSVLSFFTKDAQTVWVGTSRGIFEVKNGKANALDSLQYPNAPQSSVEMIIRRKDGSIVGCDLRRGLWHLGSTGFVYDSLPVELGVLNALMEDDEQQLWVGGSLAVACIGPKGTRIFGTKDGLKEVGTNCIVQDANGNVWIGTEGGGATKFSREAFSLYGKGTPFAQRAVFAISEVAPNHLLVGTEVGLFELKDGVITEDITFPLPGVNILAISKDKYGDPLVAAQRGTYRLHDGKYTRLEAADVAVRFGARNFATDEKGNVYGSTSRGIFTLEGDSARPFPIPQFTFGKEVINIYCGKQGTFYFTSDRNGVYRVRGSTIENFSAPRHLQSDQVISFVEDRNGNAWVGTQDGLACLRGNEVCYLNTNEGLAGNLIYVLLQDPAGDIWVGTDFGLSRITLGPDSEPLNIHNYGSEDGFTGLECNQGAGFIDTKGRIWFGTIEGLACYHPDRDFRDLRPPHLEISGLQVKLEEVDWAKRGIQKHAWTQIPVNPVFESEENHIRIEFAGITQRLPEKVKYRYRLIGLDDAYSHPSTENYAVYPFLPAGEYIFEVIACNAEGVWTKDSVQFHFVIKTPFYRTVWFGLLAFFLVMLSIVGFVRIRTANLQRQRSVLEHKVKQRTEALEQANQVKGEFLAKMSHEIRTPMNGVIGMTDLLERTTLSPQQRKFVENIRVSGQNLLSLINDILDFSRIESGKMDLENIPFEVRHLIEEVMDILSFSAFSKGLELVYWVDPEIRGPVMGDPARMKQILTNLLGNAIKFTSKGDIVVRATLVKVEGEKAEIQISVKDNGIGIPKEKHASLFESFTQVDASTTRKYGGTGLGLAISNSLSKMMGGQMWLDSELGKGTTFFFSFSAGLSEPWKFPGEAHPAKALEGKKVVIAMQNAATIALISEYLRHWKMDFEVHSTLEAASDAVLDQPDVKFPVGGPAHYPR